MYKIIRLTILSIAFLAVLPGYVSASNLSLPPSEPYNLMSIQSTDYIKYGRTTISLGSNNTIDVWGETAAYSAVDFVGVELILQYWDGYNWLDIMSVGSFSDTNVSLVSGGVNLNAQTGYHYRLKGIHTAREGTISESFISYTTSVYR